jgi:Spy/CpxP family protein refolding chaperone
VKEWKVILATLVIFGAGVLTGGLLVHQTNRVPGRPFPSFGPGQPQLGQAGQPNQFGSQRIPPNEQRMELLRHMTRQLELSQEQRKKVERIISDSQTRTKTLWEPVAAKMNDELRKTDDRIREVLTSEQQQKFDEMRARMREGREGQKMMNRPGGGPGGPGGPNGPGGPGNSGPQGGTRPPFPRTDGQRPPPDGAPGNPEPRPAEPRPPGESSPPAPPPDRQQ